MFIMVSWHSFYKILNYTISVLIPLMSEDRLLNLLSTFREFVMDLLLLLQAYLQI